VYAKALCLILKALGGSEKSRFGTAGTRNDVPLPSHTLVVALATGRLRCRWRPETDLTRCRWDAVLTGWRLGLQSCTCAPVSSPRFCSPPGSDHGCWVATDLVRWTPVSVFLLEHKHVSSNVMHDWQHLLFQQHVPIITAIDFDAWFNEEQFRTPKFQHNHGHR